MSNAVATYFDRSAKAFDAVYGGKRVLGRWIDRHFRRGIYERFALTFRACVDLDQKSVLDIGCGGGRYSIEFAKRGAANVVGVDFAPNMVALARQRADEKDVGDRCRFMLEDFENVEFDRRFDICIAIGFFDYVSQPRPYLEKMRSLANERLIMSFPSKSPIRTPIRKIRYMFKRCPVFFYDRDDIEGLVSGLGESRIVKIAGQGQDYLVSVNIS